MGYDPIFVVSGTVDMEPLRFEDFSRWNQEWSNKHRETFDEWGRFESRSYKNVLGGAPHWTAIWQYKSLAGAMKTLVCEAWRDWVTKSRPLGVTQATAHVFRPALDEQLVLSKEPGTAMVICRYDHFSVPGSNRLAGAWISPWAAENKATLAKYGFIELRAYYSATYTSPHVFMVHTFSGVDQAVSFLSSDDAIEMMAGQQSLGATNQHLDLFIPTI